MNSSMDMEDHILIIDDFTNSGGTLFGAVKCFGDLFGARVSDRSEDVCVW